MVFCCVELLDFCGVVLVLSYFCFVGFRKTIRVFAENGLALDTRRLKAPLVGTPVCPIQAQLEKIKRYCCVMYG